MPLQGEGKEDIARPPGQCVQLRGCRASPHNPCYYRDFAALTFGASALSGISNLKACSRRLYDTETDLRFHLVGRQLAKDALLYKSAKSWSSFSVWQSSSDWLHSKCSQMVNFESKHFCF